MLRKTNAFYTQKEWGDMTPSHWMSLCFCLVGVLSFLPLEAWAVTLEEQLATVNGFATGKVKTAFVSMVTIGVAILGIVKGSPKIIGVAIVIGIVLSLYLEWIVSGMKFGG